MTVLGNTRKQRIIFLQPVPHPLSVAPVQSVHRLAPHTRQGFVGVALREIGPDGVDRIRWLGVAVGVAATDVEQRLVERTGLWITQCHVQTVLRRARGTPTDAAVEGNLPSDAE